MEPVSKSIEQPLFSDENHGAIAQDFRQVLPEFGNHIARN
jgi:hypothetical protein